MKIFENLELILDGETLSIYEGVLLRAEWMKVLDYIEQEFESLDLREVGDQAKALTIRTLKVVEAGDVAFVESILDWFESFPTYDSTRRDQARREIENGEIISMEELIKNC